MKQVWKFEINSTESPIEMPKGAEILSVGFQKDTLYVWALVEIEVYPELEGRSLIVRGTGHNIHAEDLKFIGSAYIDSLVFHVFENLAKNKG